MAGTGATVQHVYIVTDCEFDGPVPGENSLLSFGSVAVSEDGDFVGEFEAVLHPLPGAAADPVTTAFWRRNPEAWAAATERPEPADAVISRFVGWIRSFDADAVFAAHPVALDGPWFDHYLRRFHGRPLFEGPWVSGRLFKHPPLCLMSMVAGKTGRALSVCDVEHYPREWLGAVVHTHRAIDDARGYAHLLRFLLAQDC
jgi:hypothetical protein